MRPSNSTHRIFAGITGMVMPIFRRSDSPKSSGTSSTERTPPPLLHPDLTYGREFTGSLGKVQGHFRWQWLAMSGIGMVLSTFMNFLGFLALVPSWPFAAFPMALMLEGYLLGTSKLIGQGNRRAYPWVIGLALFFGSLSVTLSVAGMYAGEIQFQNRLSLPVYQLEDAQKAEGNFAVAATQTQTAALGRIRNELSFFTLTSRAASTPAGTQSGFSRDRNERRSNLLALQTKWQTLDFSNDFANAKATDAIWVILRHDYAQIPPLVADTEKLTSGSAIPLPAFPVAPNHDAADSRRGGNDVTGMSQLLHPNVSWLLIVPFSVAMDFAPLVVAAAMRAIEAGDHPGGNNPDGNSPGGSSNDPDPENPTEPLDIVEDLDARQKRYRRCGDDMRVDPLGIACDAEIAEAVEAYRAEELKAVHNLTFMRSLETFDEESAILRDAAPGLGIAPDEVKRHIDASYNRLQKSYSVAIEIQDKKALYRNQKISLELVLQSAKDRLVLVKQIAEIGDELAALSKRG